MRRNQKGIAEIVFVLVIAVLIGVVVYLVFQSRSGKQQMEPVQITDGTPPPPEDIPTSTPTPTVQVLDSGESYIDTANGFKLSFPTDKSVVVVANPFLGVCDDDTRNVEVQIEIYPLDYVAQEHSPTFDGDLLIHVNKEGAEDLTVDEWFSTKCKGTWIALDPVQEDIVLAGLPAVKLSGGAMGFNVVAAVKKDGYIYLIHGYVRDSNDEESKTLLNQILSSFDFTK